MASQIFEPSTNPGIQGRRAGLDTVKLGMIYKKITRKQKHKYFFECHKLASRFLLLIYCLGFLVTEVSIKKVDKLFKLTVKLRAEARLN